MDGLMLGLAGGALAAGLAGTRSAGGRGGGGQGIFLIFFKNSI